MSRVDRRLGATFVLVALAWLWLVDRHIPEVLTEGEPGPRAVPFLLGIVLAILGIALALEPGPKGPGGTRRETGIALATFALLVVYAFLLDRAGFVISTVALMVAALAGVLRIRRWLFVAAFAATFSFGCWIVFNTLLGIPLPRGAWVTW
ncbi:MAG: hypothetical protein A3I61_07095 [Acidobacteria bacterium RIFCSPLOWO2_02_FULL_68_18]|nr:MAG: hypothetical protein A3I61_07095 [Acidobacteria bacterium RIFCSPLOWO2_02_FULL_68_18]OFW49218.1 MAG: hypothetical protein A3G77_03885 [Acidobacteria bacterium RIFCSPLOWO2_12_FULL_68_19]